MRSDRCIDELSAEWLSEHDLDSNEFKISREDAQFLYSF